LSFSDFFRVKEAGGSKANGDLVESWSESYDNSDTCIYICVREMECKCVFNVFEYVNAQPVNKKYKLLFSGALNMSGT
jgi:hypothetical protein